MIDEELKEKIIWLDTNTNTAINSIQNIETYISSKYCDRLSMKDNNILLDNEITDIGLLTAKIEEQIKADLNITKAKQNIKLIIKSISSKNIIVEPKEDNAVSDKFIESNIEIENNLKEIFDTIDKGEESDWDIYKNWKQNDCMYIRNNEGIITGVDCCYNNLLQWLNVFPYTKNKIRYNKIRMEITFNNKYISDEDLHIILQWINKYLCKTFSNLKSLYDACVGCAIKNKYNELYDYFESLNINNNDNNDYIDIVIKDVLKCRMCDTYYDLYYHCIKIALVASMKRVYYKEKYNRPLKYDNILTLCSKAQGSGKTTFFEKLFDVSNNGRSLCYVVAGTSFNPKEKDFIIQTHKYGCVLIDEVDMKRGLVNSIKGYITQQSDEFRQPFAHFSENMIRGFILVAASNNDDFLKDYTTTNERRWNPIPVTEDKTNAENVVKWFNENGLRDKLWTQIKRIMINEEDIKLWLYNDELQNLEENLQKGYKFYQTDEDYKILDDIINFEYCMPEDGENISAQEIVSQFKYGNSIEWAKLMNKKTIEKQSQEHYITDLNDKTWKVNSEKIDRIRAVTIKEIIKLMGLGCTPHGIKNHLSGVWDKKNYNFNGQIVLGYCRII